MDLIGCAASPSWPTNLTEHLDFSFPKIIRRVVRGEHRPKVSKLKALTMEAEPRASSKMADLYNLWRCIPTASNRFSKERDKYLCHKGKRGDDIYEGSCSLDFNQSKTLWNEIMDAQFGMGQKGGPVDERTVPTIDFDAECLLFQQWQFAIHSEIFALEVILKVGISLPKDQRAG